MTYLSERIIPDRKKEYTKDSFFHLTVIKMVHNVPTLGAVGDFGKLNCLPVGIYNRSTNLQLTMLAPIAPNVCYV
jgi:hypothetical protein